VCLDLTSVSQAISEVLLRFFPERGLLINNAPTILEQMDPASWSSKDFPFLVIKMNYMYILTTAILFYLLSPGVLISLPPGSSHMVQLITHALVFAVVHKYVQHGLLKQ
jgi:hypothetical protein